MCTHHRSLTTCKAGLPARPWPSPHQKGQAVLGLHTRLPTSCVLHQSLSHAKQTICLILQMPVSWQPITSLYCVRTYYEPSDYRDLTARASNALAAALRHMSTHV